MSILSKIPDNIVFYDEAKEDFMNLDKSGKIKIIKALLKISRAPSDFGTQLENQTETPLSGYRKIYVDKKSMRIVWKVIDSGEIEIAAILVIAKRDDKFVYKLASSRKNRAEDYFKGIINESIELYL